MLREFVQHWGYVAICAGTYVEGEGVLLSAGAAAHAGVLSLPLVVMSASVGSVAWGQTWFWLGRLSGEGLIARRPKWRPRVLVVERLLSRLGPWVLLLGRFVVGMGTVLPTMIGVSGFAWQRFIVLDSIGALVWASVVASVGFGVGAVLERLLGHYWTWTPLVVAGAFLALLCWLLVRAYTMLAARYSARRLRSRP